MLPRRYVHCRPQCRHSPREMLSKEETATNSCGIDAQTRPRPELTIVSHELFAFRPGGSRFGPEMLDLMRRPAYEATFITKIKYDEKPTESASYWSVGRISFVTRCQLMSRNNRNSAADA